MNTEVNQKISRFLDDDLSSIDEEKILLKISQSPELIKKLERYQLVSHTLKHNETVATNSPRFLSAIHDDIDKEPVYFLPAQKVKKIDTRVWQKSVLAVAASAVFATLFSVESSHQSGMAEIPPPIATKITHPEHQVASASPRPLEVEIPMGEPTAQQKAQHARLRAYLQAHNDDLYMNEPLTFKKTQAYARVVSQDN